MKNLDFSLVPIRQDMGILDVAGHTHGLRPVFVLKPGTFLNKVGNEYIIVE